jgi:hypothetical protein
MLIDAEDEMGRKFHADGRLESVLIFPQQWVVFWGLMRWELDGEVGWGQTQDYFPARQIRAWQRRELARQAGLSTPE